MGYQEILYLSRLGTGDGEKTHWELSPAMVAGCGAARAGKMGKREGMGGVWAGQPGRKGKRVRERVNLYNPGEPGSWGWGCNWLEGGTIVIPQGTRD